MKRVTYTIRLKGLPTPPGTISMRLLQTIADVFTQASERTLRLAIEGRSLKRGKVPEYIESSSEFLLKGMGPGSTELVLEVPTLEDTAFQQIRQLDFWDKKPQREDTVLSLLHLAIADATREQVDSDHYDSGVLEALLGGQALFQKGVQSIELNCEQRRNESIVVTAKTISSFQNLRRSTPEPQAVVLTGTINVIEYSERSFKLRLPDGTTIAGRIDESFLTEEDLRKFWGKEVTLKGQLYFRSSGAPRFIEAYLIRPFEQQDKLFSELPAYESIQETVTESRRRFGDAGTLMDLWGEWPGDENIDDLLRLLRKE